MVLHGRRSGQVTAQVRGVDVLNFGLVPIMPNTHRRRRRDSTRQLRRRCVLGFTVHTHGAGSHFIAF